jgi:hypothetical protein
LGTPWRKVKEKIYTGESRGAIGGLALWIKTKK